MKINSIIHGILVYPVSTTFLTFIYEKEDKQKDKMYVRYSFETHIFTLAATFFELISHNN